MTINLPEDVEEILNRIRTDVQSILPELNPFLRNSFISAILTGLAGRIFDSVLQQKQIIKEIFPDTAEQDEFIERWGSYKDIERNPSTKANGFVTATGIASSIIPIGSSLSVNSIEYLALAESTITTQIVSVASITRSGSTATVTTASNHNLASNVDVTIADANETEYNGTFTILVTGLDTFTYEVSGTPSTPATGTITATFTTASIEIESTTFGAETNQLAGAALTFSPAPAGVDNVAHVQFGEIGGGTDVESNDDLLARILDAYRNPISLFNVAAITKQVTSVSGVTRVFVQEITPNIGQVTVYFTRDNDDNIIPSASEVTNTKDKLLEIKPAFQDVADVIVLAPTAVPTDFTFSSITPNTSSMRDAVKANLSQFFREKPVVGKTVTSAEYLSPIVNTVDLSTGQLLEAFTLSTPVGPIVIVTGELATLGNVGF